MTAVKRRGATGAVMRGAKTTRITPLANFDAELASLFDLTGKVALLPGGYGGIGEAIAWGLAQRGAEVVLAGRSKSKAETLARSIRAAGYKAHGIALNAASVPELERAVDAAVRRFGAIDILVNCVGTQIEEPIGNVTEAAFDQVVAINLKARCSWPRPLPVTRSPPVAAASRCTCSPCARTLDCAIVAIPRIAAPKAP